MSSPKISLFLLVHTTKVKDESWIKFLNFQNKLVYTIWDERRLKTSNYNFWTYDHHKRLGNYTDTIDEAIDWCAEQWEE